jgi:pimeloyl-ACP methyl ester carboxylesterase
MEVLLLFTPRLSISEARGWYEGLRTNEVKLDAFCLAMPDLRNTDTSFSVPVFFIQGANDNVTLTSLVADYEQKIQAPAKRIEVVPDAGHFLMWTHAKEFLASLQADLRLARTTYHFAN